MNFNITSEKQFSAWLMRHINKIQHCHAVRVENSVGNGIPDINCCVNGRDVWIETKIGCETILLRPEQHAWMTRRAVAGGSAFIVSFCMIHDQVAVRRVPVAVVPHGKYLSVASGYDYMCGRDQPLHLLKFLGLLPTPGVL